MGRKNYGRWSRFQCRRCLRMNHQMMNIRNNDDLRNLRNKYNSMLINNSFDGRKEIVRKIKEKEEFVKTHCYNCEADREWHI
jgi:hypothetical protein